MGVWACFHYIPVSPSNNLRIGALRVALVEYIDRGLNILRCSVLWEEVFSQTSGVRTADSLASHLASQLQLQIIADFRSNNSALRD